MYETPIGYPPPPPGRSWKRNLKRILGVVVVLGAALFLVTRLFGPGRAAMESDAWQHRLADEAPDLKAQLEAMSFTSRQARLSDLIQKGWLRLSDDALIERAAIVSRFLTSATVHECADMAGGLPTDAERVKFVEGLSDGEWQTMLDLTIDSAIAEWRSSPPARTTTDEEFLSAIARVRDSLAGDDVARWDSIRERGIAQVDDQDLCWYARLKFAKVGELSAPYRAILARSLVEP
jgi:hypothetical protein